MAARATKGWPLFQPLCNPGLFFMTSAMKKSSCFLAKASTLARVFSELGLLAKYITTFLRMSFSIWEKILLDSGKKTPLYRGALREPQGDGAENAEEKYIP